MFRNKVFYYTMKCCKQYNEYYATKCYCASSCIAPCHPVEDILKGRRTPFVTYPPCVQPVQDILAGKSRPIVMTPPCVEPVQDILAGKSRPFQMTSLCVEPVQDILAGKSRPFASNPLCIKPVQDILVGHPICVKPIQGSSHHFVTNTPCVEPMTIPFENTVCSNDVFDILAEDSSSEDYD